MERLLDEREAAQILNMSVRSLQRRRADGTGPRFCRLGRLVRYRIADLLEWVGRSIRTSTSDPDPLLTRLLNELLRHGIAALRFDHPSQLLARHLAGSIRLNAAAERRHTHD